MTEKAAAEQVIREMIATACPDASAGAITRAAASVVNTGLEREPTLRDTVKFNAALRAQLHGKSPTSSRIMKRTAQTGSTTKVKRRSEVVSAARAKLSAELMRRYNAGESIRSLADATGRSYGFVYRLLSQEGVLRRRSGTLRRAADDRNESAEDS